MGNHYSKFESAIKFDTVKNQLGKYVYNGAMTSLKAHACGLHVERYIDIITPLYDRFPSQSFDLEIEKFEGIVEYGSCLRTQFYTNFQII